MFAASDPAQGSSRAVRVLFEIRWMIGRLCGWDERPSDEGQVSSLRDQLSPDLRAGPPGPEFSVLPFTPLYLGNDEWAAETVNRTVHAIVHLGWVPTDIGGYHGQMAVYTKPTGLLGSAYMTAITPFRHLIVYPRILRDMQRDWETAA
jgi:Protein of unknown function (DUF2867)